MDPDILKVVVWPLLVLLIVILLLLVPSTRLSIGGLLGRVTKVGVGGIEAAQVQASGAKPATPTAAQLPASDPLVEPIIRRYRAYLDANARDPAQREEIALHHAARQEIWLWHEWRYRSIFGSQLKLIESASSSGAVPVGEARRIYDAAKAATPQIYGSYSFEQWLMWLTQNGLLNQDVASVHPTPLARDFLVWMDSQRLSRQKPG